MPIKKIVSGGQSGVDRAALDAAINNHIVHGGWCPKGRLAEDGAIDIKYKLRETDHTDYADRTARNVRDTDATLILSRGRLDGGTALTLKLARTMHKPCLKVDLNREITPDDIRNWIVEHRVRTLNIAGPRESRHPGIYQQAYKLLDTLLKKIYAVAQSHKG